MKNAIFLIIMIMGLTISAQDIEIAKLTHISYLKNLGFNELSKYKHESYVKIEGEYINGKHAQQETAYSVYYGDNFFSFYTEKIHGITEIKKSAKAIILETTYKIEIQNRTETISYNVIYPISKEFTGYAVYLNKKATTIATPKQILQSIFKYSNEIYQAFQEKAKLSLQYIIVAQKIAKEIHNNILPTKAKRDIVVKSITWSIVEEQVKQFGNGTVMKYEIWYKGGVGKVIFDLMNGYLFMTCRWGKRNGTGKLWQMEK